MAQNYLNADGLFLQFGTDKATVDSGGDYKNFGTNRVAEVFIDLTTLTSTAAIQSNTLIFPSGSGIFIEKVELVVETASASGTSFSVGFIQMDRSTIPSNYSTALVNALINASTNTLGDVILMTVGSTSAGGLLGSFPASATGPYYISALSSGTYTTGKVKVRVFYHGVGTISQ